jgi:hypothetical protein
MLKMEIPSQHIASGRLLCKAIRSSYCIEIQHCFWGKGGAFGDDLQTWAFILQTPIL